PRLGVALLLLIALGAPTWEDASESSASSQARSRPPSPDIALGATIASGFVGLSFEFTALPAYAGDASAINPLLVKLIRNLAPGQSPVLRIGGNSTDWTWLPVRGAARPADVSYRLTPAWLHTAGALARALDARMILGVNLAMNRPALAVAEARAMVAAVGRPALAALEIGNEGDVYRRFPRYRNSRGSLTAVRARSYNFREFLKEFAR